jgi:predicted ribonuclease YlaK
MRKRNPVSDEIYENIEHNFAPLIEFKKREWKFTQKQKEIISRALDPEARILFLHGPAGTAKTYLALYCSFLMMSRDKTLDLLYVRTATESASKQMGALPGNLERKFDPFVAPLYDKMEEILTPSSVASTMKSGMLKASPVNFLRGASWMRKLITIDEAQNFDRHEIATALTRLGKDSKLIVCGDPKQSDLNGKNCFPHIISTFDDEESRAHGIFVFELDESEIHRDEIIKFLIKKLDL